MHGYHARREKFNGLIRRTIVDGRVTHEDLLAALMEAYVMGQHRTNQRNYRAKRKAAA